MRRSVVRANWSPLLWNNSRVVCNYYVPYSSSRYYAGAPRSVSCLGIVGAGQMGAGIAQVAAQVAKIDVILTDLNPSVAENARNQIDKLLSRSIVKGKITEEEKRETLKKIKISSSLKDLKDADFVVEAVTENIEVKKQIFSELSEITRENAILASNTSSISITKIASFTNRPERVIGMHFMNPVPVMKLVEIISGLATSAETLSTTLALAEEMGKTCAESDDRPGFIANRLLLPYINEAIFALQDGVAGKEAIDTTMKLGTNMPMGPLQLADFIGLDTCLAILNVLHSELGARYKAAPLLVKYVDAGWLGVKSGQGFYRYDSPGSRKEK